MGLRGTIANLIERRLSPANQWRFQIVVHAFHHARISRPRTRECNICGSSGYFKPGGWPMRSDAICPNCGSSERQRLLKLWADQTTISSGKALHFAPEPAVLSFLRPLVPSYVTADIIKGRADLVLDIERLDLPDNSFDLIICNHVLEHVDDRAALSEMFRVLSPGGLALLSTPVVEGWTQTYENPDIQSEEDRIAHFGQYDHVRFFGSDIRDRIRAAGFTPDEFKAVEPYVQRFALLRGDTIFLAHKPSAAS